jgi:FkbM family methyltransferase
MVRRWYLSSSFVICWLFHIFTIIITSTSSNDLSFYEFNKQSVEIYHDFMHLRNQTLREVFNNDYSIMKPWEGLKGGYYLWDYFYPAFNCPYRERIGKLSEGGKILCNPLAYRYYGSDDDTRKKILKEGKSSGPEGEQCNIFSFGVRDDISFEIEFAKLTKCQIFTFDPSVNSLPDKSKVMTPCESNSQQQQQLRSDAKLHTNNCGGNITFDSVGLGIKEKKIRKQRQTWLLKSINQLMNEKNITHLHLLKIDIEGGEWDVFLNSFRETAILQHVDQLLIELHFKQETTNNAGIDSGVREVFELFQIIESSGLYAFSSEVNHNPSGYANEKNYCIEYSFIRPFSLPMMKSPPPRPPPLLKSSKEVGDGGTSKNEKITSNKQEFYCNCELPVTASASSSSFGDNYSSHDHSPENHSNISKSLSSADAADSITTSASSLPPSLSSSFSSSSLSLSSSSSSSVSSSASSSASSSDSPLSFDTVHGKGIIATLIKREDTLDKYDKSVRARNQAIERFLYITPHTNISMDIVLFHEGSIDSIHQQYIQAGTPNMPILFVNVSAVFAHYHYVNNPFCPRTWWSTVTTPGYHSMCYFWFVAFRNYTLDYEWLLRIDDDVILINDIRTIIQSIPSSVAVASPRWHNLFRSKHDKINGAISGAVVQGLHNLTNTFGKAHGLNYLHTWEAPYTNLMYVNLSWYRTNQLILDFTQAVVETECIYSNRWGDLPLWGAALALVENPDYFLKISYYHGSHKMLIQK